MAKTLIVQDADFSTNKIETVSFDPQPPVPTLQVYWDWFTSGPTDPTGAESATYGKASSANIYKYITAFGKGDSATSYEIAPSSAYNTDYPYAIKIPEGTTKVKLDATDKSKFYSGPGPRLIWTKDEASGQTSLPNYIRAMKKDTFDASNIPIEFNVPSGADSFFVTVRFTDDQSSYVTGDALAEAIGLSIEFLND